MFEIEIYTTEDGRQPYLEWLASLDGQARNRVVIAVGRLAEGNTGSLKSVGEGVHEIRLTYGAGIRVYLGREGQKLVILLHGGTKHRQSKDITKAKEFWRAYQDTKGG